MNSTRTIYEQNLPYFDRYPARAGWLTGVTPCAKKAYWDVEYTTDFLRMREMRGCKMTGRVVMIDDNGVYDNGDKK